MIHDIFYGSWQAKIVKKQKETVPQNNSIMKLTSVIIYFYDVPMWLSCKKLSWLLKLASVQFWWMFNFKKIILPLGPRVTGASLFSGSTSQLVSWLDWQTQTFCHSHCLTMPCPAMCYPLWWPNYGKRDYWRVTLTQICCHCCQNNSQIYWDSLDWTCPLSRDGNRLFKGYSWTMKQFGDMELNQGNRTWMGFMFMPTITQPISTKNSPCTKLS